MNKGSTRITVRVGDEMLGLVDAYLESRLVSKADLEPWNRTDFIMAAIAEKLSHVHRSRKTGMAVRQEKVDPYRPREVTEE